MPMPVTLALRAAEREARMWSKLWRSAAFTNFGGPVLMLLTLGIGVGGLIDSAPPELLGLDYLDFITPGLMVGAVAQTAAMASLWPVMSGHRWIGFYYAEVATPLRPQDVYAGQVIWVSTRATLQASVFLLAGTLIGGVSSWLAILAVPAAALTAMAFTAPLSAFAATQDSDVSFDLIVRVAIMPLYLFSGTLFPIEQLPGALQLATKFFPMWHGVELARNSTTGSLPVVESLVHVAVLCGYIAVGWIWGVRTFKARLTP